jgi:sensor histidine kinase YesM
MSIMTDELIQSLHVETYQSGRLIDNASNNMNKALVAQRTLIFSDHKSNKFMSIYEAYKSNVQLTKENTEQAKSFILENEKKGRLTPNESLPDVSKLIDNFFKSFEQWESRSNTIIESMSTRGLRGEDKLIYQALILDEAIAADEKFDLASHIINDIEHTLDEKSTIVTKQIKKNKQQLQMYLIIIAGLTFAIALTLSLLVSRNMLNSIKQLVHLTKRVSRGDLSTDVIMIKSKDEIGLLSTSFISMCKRLSEYIEIVYISKIREKEAELRALQLQIQPHFLFNTLEVIRMKAVKSGELQVARMLKILADIYRWNAKGRHSIVTVEEELAYTSSYLNLQEIRFQDRLLVETVISSDILQMGIPKLIMQPLVENAISHGFRNKADQCVIRIVGYKDNEDLIVECSDNGEGIDPEIMNNLQEQMNEARSEYENIGLKNVHARISLLYGLPYGLSIRSVHGEGSTITIRIPAQYNQEMKDSYDKSDDRR